jgi:activator of 2-hydroxyglutaryl-CoA dehydratase
MTHTVGIDVGSTYTKAVVLRDDHAIVGRAMLPTMSSVPVSVAIR